MRVEEICDFTSLDNFLWGYVKRDMYKTIENQFLSEQMKSFVQSVRYNYKYYKMLLKTFEKKMDIRINTESYIL